MLFKLTIFFASLVAAIGIFTSPTPSEKPFEIIIFDAGLEFHMTTNTETIKDLLEEQSFALNSTDIVFPLLDYLVTPGTQITIVRATPVILSDGGHVSSFSTQARSIDDFLIEQGIALEENDSVSPPLDTEIIPDIEITITRITEKEITRTVPISPKTVFRDSPDLSYGKTILIAQGQPGQKEERVLVVYKNGGIDHEHILDATIIKTAEPKIIERGTRIEIGNVQEGRASWYCPSYSVKIKTGMTTASRDYPKGTFLRVTNLRDKSKTVIVEVTDWVANPDVVIDLWCTAFKKLAPLSKGIVWVSVEEIL